jgi:hypothetical protein
VSGLGADYPPQLADLDAKTDLAVAQLKYVRLQLGSKAAERLWSALGLYLNAVALEFEKPPAAPASWRSSTTGSDGRQRPYSLCRGAGQLDEGSFESRRQELSESVLTLETDIWETIRTGLILAGIIAGASIFRISSFPRSR